MTSGPRIALAAVLTMLAVSGIATPGMAHTQPVESYQGLQVVEVLRRLQARGAPIIYSSALVTADLRVKEEPRQGSGLRELAAQILQPHGLAIVDGPRNSWMVVRAPRAAPRLPPKVAAEPHSLPQSPPSPSPIRIDERVQVNERAGDAAGAPNVYKLDVDRAIDTAGSLENLFQSLASIPGVAATNDHDNKLAVRGGGPEHNMVVFDGVQIYSHQRLASDLGGQQSFVNPATVANMGLDAAGLDARYGGRLSSATLFETRDGPTNRRLAISGTAGLTSGDAIAEGRLPGTQAGSWWVTLRGTYYRLVADRFKEGDIPSFLDVQFKVSVKPSPRTRLSVLGLMGAEAMVRPILAPPDHRRNFAGDNLREFHAQSRLAILRYQWTPTPRVSTTTTFDAYSNASRDQDGWIDWLTGEPFERRVRVVDLAARQQALIAWSPRHLLEVGGEVHGLRGSWAMKGMDLLPTRPPGPDVRGRFVEYDGPIDRRLDRTQFGAWAQERIPLGAGLAIEPGVRLDWNSFTGETAVQPRFRLTKAIGQRTIVWTGVAWQAQTPGFETMQQGTAYYDLVGSHGSDLRNERSRQIVGGVEQRLAAGMTLRVEAYHRAFDRLLTQRLESDREREARLARYAIPGDMPPGSALLEHRPTADPESTGTGRATGLEVLLDRARGRLSGWVSYALSQSDRDWHGRTVPFEYDRRHAVGAAIDIALTSKVRVSVRSQYGSGFPVTPLHEEVVFNDARNVFPGPPPGSRFVPARDRDGRLFLSTNLYDPPRLSLLNSTRLSAYARTDLRGTFTVWRDWEAYGEIINLFDRENFRGRLRDASPAGGRPIDYQVAPAFPRLVTYGVRFKF